MSDPRHTDPRHDVPPPDPNERGSNASMWAWIAGIAVVILIAFVLAAGWNSNTQTAGNAPPATMGSGGATTAPSTTGSGTTGGAPAMAPDRQATPKKPAPDTGTK